MKNRWLLGGTHVVAALIGAGIASGFCIAHWHKAVRGAVLTSDVAVSAHYAALVEASRGDDAQYERSLRAYVNALDVLLNREPRTDMYESIAFDKALGLQRLALIAQQRGDETHAAEHAKAAALACEASGRNDCTTDKLRDWAARLPISNAAAPRGK